jgi:hypothetical protein
VVVSFVKRKGRPLFLAFGLCVVTACAPFAHHGPWVRQGISGDVLTAGGVSVDPSGGDDLADGFLLGVDAALRYGVVPQDTTMPAFSVGLQAPLLPFLVFLGEVDAHFVELVTGDVYVAGPRTQTLATSMGFSGSPYHKLPYIQVGSRSPHQKGWYTTHGFLIREDGFKMWLPAFTWVTPVEERARASHITVGGGLGRDNDEMVYMLMLGITMEFYRKDARVR